MTDLSAIVELSREFGTVDYVKGGGGNTSMKNERTLWIKPSGTNLGELTADTFVALNRARINELYDIETPAESAGREELVKNLMADAVENDTGRASVEAPLHNVFESTFVVHTHPPVVNGMTCAEGADKACAELFPDALWVEYVDPGYTLCMEVRKRIKGYVAEHGREPGIVLMKNHGIFVAAQTADDVRALYRRVTGELKAVYREAGVSAELEIGDAPDDAATGAAIRSLFGGDAAFVVSCGTFACPPGPISPDHLVYAKSFPFTAALTADAADAYRAEHGYAPKIVVAGDRVYGIGASQRNAELALEMAQDGAQVMQLAEAFGGINYMTDAQREFIENWEVESYRQKQI